MSENNVRGELVTSESGVAKVVRFLRGVGLTEGEVMLWQKRVSAVAEVTMLDVHDGAQYLLLMKPDVQVEVFRRLGFSPLVEDVYAWAEKEGWFNPAAVGRYGFMLVEADACYSDDGDEYLAMMKLDHAAKYRVPAVPVSEKALVLSTGARVGPGCMAQVQVPGTGDVTLSSLERSLQLAVVRSCGDAMGVESGAKAQVSQSVVPVDEVVDQYIATNSLFGLAKGVQTTGGLPLEHAARVHVLGGEIPDPSVTGYCYLSLFDTDSVALIARQLGEGPTVSCLLACYAAAMRRGVAKGGYALVSTGNGVLHVCPSPQYGCQEVLGCMVLMATVNPTSRVAGSMGEVCAAGMVLCTRCSVPATHTPNLVTVSCSCGASSIPGASVAPDDARRMASVKSHGAYAYGDLDRRIEEMVKTGKPFETLRTVNAKARELALMPMPCVVCRDDLGVKPGVSGCSYHLDPGAYVLNVHDRGFQRGLAVVAVAVMVILPAGCVVQLPGGQVVESGNVPVRMLFLDKCEFAVVEGLELGEPLTVLVGGYNDRVRWSHKYAKLDAASTEARFWTKTGIPVAVCSFREDSSREHAAKVSAALVTEASSELKFYHWSGIDPGPEGSTWDEGRSPEDVGIGISEVVTSGFVYGGSEGSAVLVQKGRVEVCGDGGQYDTGLKVCLSPGQGVVVVGKYTVGFCCEIKELGLVRLFTGDDAYMLDDGGPSDDEGFLDEF